MKPFKRNLLMVSLLFLLRLNSSAQLAYSPLVESVSATVGNERVLLLLRQISGDTTVTINGEVKTITSRHYLSPGNALAAQFIYEEFEQYGYQPVFQSFNGTRGANVIATKTGFLYPNKEYIICGHYDNMPSGPLAPGADDNASGIVAVLEAARILSNIDLEYTVKFIAWDEEEIGMAGSKYYAQQASLNGDNILGVLNVNMLAWDSNNDNKYSISKNANSEALSNDFVTTTGYYQPQLSHNFITTASSDHASFWLYGYPAILAIENFYDFNAHYHTPADHVDAINLPYFGSMVRASVANITSCALNQRINLQHEPVVSNGSTLPRMTSVTVISEHPVASNDANAPRLYYSIDSLTFNYILPSASDGDLFTFSIPGFPASTNVIYYFAAQDASATMIATLPSGGKGLNPPGTIAPMQFFNYRVDNIAASGLCSVNTPIVINDNSNTYDQITVNEQGDLVDIDVMVDITHPRTYELRLVLISPDNTPVSLSDRNGNEGDNYTQTIFDDQAVISIKEGVAPFTGRFRPETPLNSLKNKEIKGQWQLRVAESGNVNSGMLNQWCLHFLYKDYTIGLEENPYLNNEILYQNFPNPASKSTTIKFRLPNKSNITLSLYDINGNRIHTLISGFHQAGMHLLVISVSDLEPGMYLYTLESDYLITTKKMIIIN